MKIDGLPEIIDARQLKMLADAAEGTTHMRYGKKFLRAKVARDETQIAIIAAAAKETGDYENMQSIVAEVLDALGNKPNLVEFLLRLGDELRAQHFYAPTDKVIERITDDIADVLGVQSARLKPEFLGLEPGKKASKQTKRRLQFKQEKLIDQERDRVGNVVFDVLKEGVARLKVLSLDTAPPPNPS